MPIDRQNLLRLSELPRAGFEMVSMFAASPWLAMASRGESHPVVVIPGFLASDDSTAILRRYLSILGYDVYPWAQGRNMGAGRMGGYEPLVKHVLDIYQKVAQPVSLIGWSLGGVHALAVAERIAFAVRQIITLGSPINYHGATTPIFNTLQHAARQMNGRLLETPQAEDFGLHDPLHRLSDQLPVTAVYSKSDGVVPWQRSLIEPGPGRDNIEVYSSHIGLGFNPAVMYAVADRLALPKDDFAPFHRRGWRGFTYPVPRAVPQY